MRKNLVTKTGALCLIFVFLLAALSPVAFSMKMVPLEQPRSLLQAPDVMLATEEDLFSPAETKNVLLEDILLKDEPVSNPPVPLDTPQTFYDVVGRIYKKPTSYAELVSWYQRLEENYSGYIQVFKANELYSTGTIPKTGGGSYDLYYVRVTNESLGYHKPEVFFSGGPHGNEKIGAVGLYWALDWLMRHAFHPQYDSPERAYLQWLLDNREIYIDVFHNPDGFDQNVRGDYLGRDLNREADHDASYGPFASVNGQTIREFINKHLIRTAVWHHTGARKLLYPWQQEHSTITGVSPITARSYGHVPADFFFFDAAGLLLGDYIGDYGGDLTKDDIGSSYAMGFGGPGVLTSWAYGGDDARNTAEDTYVTAGPHVGAGVFAWDPEVYGTGDPTQSMYGNDTINRFGAEIRRMFLYITDIAQPSVHWTDDTSEITIEVEPGEPVDLSWLVHGCLVVDHTSLQYGMNPNPIQHPQYFTSDIDTYADQYYGGSYWDLAVNGNVSSTVYTETLVFDDPGDYYVVAKAMVDQKYADVLRPDYYGSDSYLRMINERTDESFSETLIGTDGVEEIDGQLWWYSPVVRIRARDKGLTWYNTSFPYRKELTIDHTKVQADLQNFPVLVDITDTDLASKAQTTGNDIIFTDLFNNKLNHEIEYYNSGHLISWVNVTNLLSTVDTVLYMYYGNQTIGNQQNPVGVWDEYYMMVQHLNETSGTHYDSTSNNNDGSPMNGIIQGATGKIDGADDFDGTNDHIRVPHASTLTGFTVGMTLSAWVKPEVVGTRQSIFCKHNSTNGKRSYFFDYLGGSELKFVLCLSTDGTTYIYRNASFNLRQNVWYYVTVTWTSDHYPTFFINGSQIALSQQSGQNISAIYSNSLESLYIGRSYATSRFFNGIIDDAQISNINRSAAWIKTSYTNQVNPSSFLSVGTEKGPIVISDPIPSDDEMDVFVSTTSIKFNLTHVQGKLMDYTVVTSPDVGSADITGAGNGTYSVTITGLEECAFYTWTVHATDGTNEISETFSFSTECHWWKDWAYRKQITIPSAGVSGSLTHFPVLIDITDADLATKALSTGDDIVFTTIDHHQLSHEIEFYESGHLIVWVNVTSLSSTQDTLFYMYYGKADAENQENPTGVWDSHYMMVQHLSETSGIHYDSTNNDNDGEPKNGVTQDATGWIDGADEFDRVDDCIIVPHDATLAGYTVGMTVSTWIKLDSNTDRIFSILTKYNTSGTNLRGWQFYYDDTNVGVTEPVMRFVISQDGSDFLSYYVPFAPEIDIWYYVTVIWSSGQRPIFYINDVASLPSVTGTYTSICNNDPEPLYIGKSYTTDRVFDGIIDEVCISNVARSEEWVLTSYNNQINPGMFYEVGFEEIFGNNPPRFSSELPTNNSIDISVNQETLSITIEDPEGDDIDWTIEGKYVNNAEGYGEDSGTKSATLITPLPYETQIIWYVNSTDSESGIWRKAVYYFTTEEAPITWWDTSWNNRRLITIDHSMVAGSLSNFPVLIDITNESLAAYAQSNGNDFVFTDDTGVVLDHEIELYMSDVGHLIAWVNVPALSAEEDTFIVMYYGNPTCENQQNPAGVWDSHYMMVQHLSETSGTHYDSTSNANDGTPNGGVTQGVTGKIDGADEFDGTDDAVTIPHDDTLAGFTNGMTLSAWVKLDTIDRRVIISKYATSTSERSWSLEYLNSPNSLQVYASSDGTNALYWQASFSPTLGIWYYITFGWQSNELPTFYVNGNKIPITTGTSTLTSLKNNENIPVYIGRTYTTPPERCWDGMIDEVHVSNINRSAAWITTSYNNQNNPISFYSLGVDEVQSLLPVIYFENPQDTSTNIPFSLSTLSVKLYNPDKNLMSYSIETSPDIGSISGTSGNGIVSVSIIGLSSLTTYHWFVNVTDGTHETRKVYTFVTKSNSPPEFSNQNPLDGSIGILCSIPTLSVDVYDEDNQLLDYTIQTSPNIGSSSGSGVGNGLITVDVIGLSVETIYHWFVNVTDGMSWTRAVYEFTTEGPWWDTDWQYRRLLSVDHEKVAGDLMNFPVLVSLPEDAYLAEHALDSGDDLVFVTYSGTKLNHEVEYFNGETGQLVAWVHVASLSSSQDTVMYLYYGNGDASNQENPAGVWDEHYMMVQHLSETSGTHYDSTSNANDGTPNGGVTQGVTGKIDGADEFDGTDDAVTIPHDDTLAGFNVGMTTGAWVKFDSSTVRRAIVSKYGTTDPEKRSWNLEFVYSSGSRYLQFTASATGGASPAASYWQASFTPTLGIWYYIVVGWETNKQPTFYVNGNKIPITGSSGSNLALLYNNDQTPLYIGRTYTTPPERCWDGLIDEVRVSNINRSAAWITTSYNNQNDPSSFISLGSQETASTLKQYTISVKQYWNLISLPFNELKEKSAISVRYDDILHPWSQAVTDGYVVDHFFEWDPAASSYDVVDALTPGTGVWMWAYYDCDLVLTSSVDEDSNLCGLAIGWNMVGLPVNSLYEASSLFVSHDGFDYSWAEATTGEDPILLGFIYGWDRENQMYLMSDSFEPGASYWMYAYKVCSLKKGD